MQKGDIEHKTFKVDPNFGSIIGNTLRQFAMRGSETWQVIAYRVGSRSGTFGFSADRNFNYLDLLDGSLLYTDETHIGSAKICDVSLVGDNYVGELNGKEIVITGLKKLGIPRMEVCLACFTGSRTVAQNRELIYKLRPGDAQEFSVVPSKHTLTTTFSFEVKPCNSSYEQLSIEADKGVVELARQTIVALFSGLQEMPT